jgi:hypothetical protein
MYATPDFHQRQNVEFRVCDPFLPLGLSLDKTRMPALVDHGKEENRAATDQRMQVVDLY